MGWDAVTDRISSLFTLRRHSAGLLFGGQGLSLVGTWITRVAVGWLVFRLTGSAWMLGVVGFTGQIPVFLWGPVAGVLVDRWRPRRVLILTQVLSMIQAFMGMPPIGSLLAGYFAGNFGSSWALLCSGAICLAGGLFFALQRPGITLEPVTSVQKWPYSHLKYRQYE